MSDVITIDRLRKNYVALRPLRIESLRLAPARRTALLGIDADGAEILVNLITGSSLPDEGTIGVFGRETTAIASADEWLATLGRFGVISRRADLLDELTVAQNLALAFGLSVDPVPDAVMAEVRRLSVESGVPLEALTLLPQAAGAVVRARCHLARALAVEPSVLLVEHGQALTEPADAAAFGRDIARAARGRHLAVLAITADESFADAVAGSVYAVEPATGRLVPRSGWRRWFG